MITTDDDILAPRLQLLAAHGMSRDAWKRYGRGGNWHYEVLEPGFKSNMTDLQASLGIHQLRRLDGFIARRREIAARYHAAFADLPELRLPTDCPRRPNTYHLFPIRLAPGAISRDELIEELRQVGIGSSVHFIPLHRHPYYEQALGYRPEQFPVAERMYQGLLSLPLYPKMSDADVEDVIGAVREVFQCAMAI